MRRNSYFRSEMTNNKIFSHFFLEKCTSSCTRTRWILRPRLVAALFLVALVVILLLPHDKISTDSTTRSTKSTKDSSEKPTRKSGGAVVSMRARDTLDLDSAISERYGDAFATELRNVFSPSRPRVPAAKLDKKTGKTPWMLLSDEDVWLPEDGKLIPLGSFEAKSSFRPAVCFVARTYYKHDPRISVDSVDKFIASLMLQRFPLWQLVLIDTGSVKGSDVPQFDYLHTKLKEFAEHFEPQRIKVVSLQELPTPPEQYRYRHLTGGNETEDFNMFHTHLYWLTDHVIRTHCHPDTQYVVATNGDNWYHPEFITSILEANEKWLQAQRDNNVSPLESLDVVSVDFYSRWAFSWTATEGQARLQQRGCKLFQVSAPGMANHHKLLKTDLGANAFRYRKLVDDYKFFHNLTCGKQAGHDGCFFDSIQQWKRKTVDSCLYSHGPNAFQCMLYGGVMLTSGEGSERFQCAHSAEEFTRSSKLFEGAAKGEGETGIDGRCYEHEEDDELQKKVNSKSTDTKLIVNNL